MSNTGKAGLNWEDNDKFGGGANLQYNEDEGYFYSSFESDEFNTWGGRYNGEGLPTAWTGGFHFSNKWNADKRNVNTNYRFNKMNLGVIGRKLTQDITDDDIFYGDEKRNTRNQNIRHQLNGFYDVQLDSFSSIKFTVAGSRTTGRSYQRFDYTKKNQIDTLVNEGWRTLQSEGLKQQFNSNFIWRLY